MTCGIYSILCLLRMWVWSSSYAQYIRMCRKGYRLSRSWPVPGVIYVERVFNPCGWLQFLLKKNQQLKRHNHLFTGFTIACRVDVDIVKLWYFAQLSVLTWSLGLWLPRPITRRRGGGRSCTGMAAVAWRSLGLDGFGSSSIGPWGKRRFRRRGKRQGM